MGSKVILSREDLSVKNIEVFDSNASDQKLDGFFDVLAKNFSEYWEEQGKEVIES